MKKIMGALIFLISLASVLYIYNHVKRIHLDQDIQGFIYSNDSRFEKETSIHLQGTLHKKLFSGNVIVGKLTLDHDIEYDVNLHYENGRYFGVFTLESDLGMMTTSGSILFSNNLNRTWIQSDDIDSKYQLNEGYVSGPSTNREEANDIARSFFHG